MMSGIFLFFLFIQRFFYQESFLMELLPNCHKIKTKTTLTSFSNPPTLENYSELEKKEFMSHNFRAISISSKAKQIWNPRNSFCEKK